MASIADTLIQQGFQGGDEAQKGVESVQRLGQQIQNQVQAAQELQLKKQQLQNAKYAEVLSTIETGLTKVPQKARNSFFKNFLRNRAGQFGITVSDDFIDALQSPDVNQGALARQLVDFRDKYRIALDNPEDKNALEEAAAASEELQAAFGGDVTKFGPFLNTAMTSEVMSKERAARRATQAEQFDTKESRASLESLRRTFDQNTRQDRQKLTAADNAISLLTTDTAIGDEASKTQLARLAGEVGNLTEGDIGRFGGSRDLVERVKQFVETASTGRITKDNRKQLLQVAQEVRDVLSRKVGAEAERQVEAGKVLRLDPNQVRQFISAGYTTASQVQKKAPKPKEDVLNKANVDKTVALAKQKFKDIGQWSKEQVTAFKAELMKRLSEKETNEVMKQLGVGGK